MTSSKLYAAVWAEPLTRVTRRLRLSDTGFAKACRRDNVPVPGRGYWSRLGAGQPVAPVPLPPADGDPEVAFPRVGPAARVEKQTALAALMSRLGQQLDGLANAPPEVSDETPSAALPDAAPPTAAPLARAPKLAADPTPKDEILPPKPAKPQTPPEPPPQDDLF